MLDMLPAKWSDAVRFSAHRYTCHACYSFDGQVKNLGVLCLKGTALLKDDWIDIERDRREKQAAA